MGYAVELFIDEHAGRPIRQLFEDTRSALATLGTRPHISLTVFEEVDVSRLTSIVERLASDLPPFSVRFSSVGLFPGPECVVFVAPVVTDGLLRIHARLHRQLERERIVSDPRYQPGAWVPHCSITVQESRDSASRTVQQVGQAPVFGAFPISEVALIAFRPVVEIARFALKGAGGET